ncbi:uncharacterized protein BT62DRAFT_1046248 [Guyanagaster necrorhizus]|uniref:Uncharacterized protein n=1 Tax=Guyanagaster necrorhizus TaxID=856835 RepID=A0A9P8AMG2_9AGAR|nr:uncharacterized protein BT62DRAFT_1046248 [Guyanagaster necrorhizus MCA 3950]KAG7441228.1 hypothetical protein BT62DRAFT_1046248 [Guyanagaster necrorhizus MCA 3950]
MSDPTKVDNEVVIAERGDQRLAIPRLAFLQRSFSSFQAYANQQLDTAGGTFVTQSLKGQEGREVLIPKQHWAAVKPQIRSVKIQRPPTPGMGFCDILFLAMVSSLKANLVALIRKVRREYPHQPYVIWRELHSGNKLPLMISFSDTGATRGDHVKLNSKDKPAGNIMMNKGHTSVSGSLLPIIFGNGASSVRLVISGKASAGDSKERYISSYRVRKMSKYELAWVVPLKAPENSVSLNDVGILLESSRKGNPASC